MDEFSWVDSVVPPDRALARAKRLTIGEHEFQQMSPTSDGQRRLRTRFFINTTEIEATLVEVGHDAGATEAKARTHPRLRLGGRFYLLTIASSADQSRPVET